MYKIIFYPFILLIISLPLIGNETFYAISSLRFYYETKNSPLFFTPQEIDSLWNTASNSSSVASLIKQAKAFSLQNDSDNTSFLLKKAWVCLQREILDCVSVESCEGSRFPENVYLHFHNNPLITQEMRKKIKPYLLPSKHHLKWLLDGVFVAFRVMESDSSLQLAGFSTLCIAPTSFLRIAKHPQAEGYIFKIPLDSDLRKKQGRPAWEWLVDRCIGAENIRKLIKKEKIIYYGVPEKWIYLPPEYPKPSIEGCEQQPLLLIATDMQLVSSEETGAAWKTLITTKHLDELYCILSHGYASAYVKANIPFSKTGKFVCIDTEYPKRKIKYHQVRPYLSEEMLQYWDQLVKKGGNKQR